MTVWKGDAVETVQEIGVSPNYQIVSVLENEMHKILFNFEIQIDHSSQPEDQT